MKLVNSFYLIYINPRAFSHLFKMFIEPLLYARYCFWVRTLVKKMPQKKKKSYVNQDRIGFL